LDVQGFLEQLGNYRDFTPRFRSLESPSGTQRYISPSFLENVLQDAPAKIEFRFVGFESAREGRAFATLGRNVNVAFMGCAFSSDAADAFLEGMITKSDWNVGLTGMTIGITMAFSEEILLTLLRMNLLDTYEVTGIFTGNLSDEALRAIQESQLKTLSLAGGGFDPTMNLMCFLIQLQSNVLERLTLISYYDESPIPAVAMAIKQCPALIHVNLNQVQLDGAHWDCLLNAFRNHKVLSSLTLKKARWRDYTYEQAALGFATMLKENSNIEKLETESFFNYFQEARILETRIMPQVEHNYYSKRLPSLQRAEAASMRAALVAQALGRGLQGKPTIQYELLKANVDLIRNHGQVVGKTLEEHALHEMLPRKRLFSKTL